MIRVLFLIIIIFGCTVVNQAKVSGTGFFYKEYLKIIQLEEENRYEEAIKYIDDLLQYDDDPYLVLKKGEYLIKINKYDEARNLYLDYVKRNKYPPILFNLVNLYKSHYKDLDNAIKYMEILVSLDKSEQNMLELARLYESNTDFSKAIGIMNELIKVNPSSAYYYQRGILYLKLGLEKNGIKDLEKAYEIDKYPLALYKLADYYLKKDDKEKAIYYLSKILERHPNQVNLSFQLGRLYIDVKDYDKAIKLFEEIAKSKNELLKITAMKQLASIYSDKKDYKKALEYFKKIIEIKKDDTQAYYFAGYLSEIVGDTEAAITYYNEALKVDPDYVEPKKRLVLILSRKKEFNKALELLNSIEKSMRDVDFYRLKAAIYYEQKVYQKAIQVLNDALKEGIDDEDVYFDLAINYEKVKDFSNAEKYLLKVIELNPKNSTALNFLGYMYAEKGIKLDEAYRLVKKALEIEPDNPAYIDSMGWIYYQKGDYKRAFDYLKRAYFLAPEEVEIKEHFISVIKKLYPDKNIDDFLKKSNE